MTEKAITFDNIKDFDADQIFDCGQCFRFEKEEDGSWTGTARGRVLNARFEGGRLQIASSGAEERETEIWRSYFDLDRDYGKIKEELSERDPVIRKAIDFGRGIRILRQDPWETILSFIISQNNNIPRIKKCVESVAGLSGEKLGEMRGRTFYALPAAEKLAALSEEDLACCRLGYRAKYTIWTARKIAEDGPDKLAFLASDEASSEEAFEYVSGLCGVGPKVANCILLFGLSKYDRFPVDVWMKKIMAELYGFKESDVKGMERFAKETYGRWGGMAQQYLFYYARSRERK